LSFKLNKPEMNKFNLTRYAPTPSGYLHFGNLYSFVLTYHLAKKHQAKILLRIDDLDKERVKPKYIQDIFDTLDFLSIPFDIGPRSLASFKKDFSQHLRKDHYATALEQLHSEGQLFACDCSRSKIIKMNKKGIYTGFCRDRKLPFDLADCSWRINTGAVPKISIKTLKHGETIAAMPVLLRDTVLHRKDGLPAYQLASLVDDNLFGVDLIIRGKDLWGSSLVQLYIARHLVDTGQGYLNSTFHHHPLLMGPNQQKLSKSSGDTSIRYFRQQGRSPEQIYQKLADMLDYRRKVKDINDFDDMIK
jgi:glutamyl/glutaminyl-tRNA synthetase